MFRLSSSGFSKSKVLVNKSSKLYIPGHDPPIDITLYIYIFDSTVDLLAIPQHLTSKIRLIDSQLHPQTSKNHLQLTLLILDLNYWIFVVTSQDMVMFYLLFLLLKKLVFFITEVNVVVTEYVHAVNS
jgi:hypothetical protein